MKIRIDLLDAAERRHQGPVSARFAWRTLLWSLATVAALGAAFAVYATLDNRQAVRRGEEVWAGMQPRRDAVRQIRGRLGEATGYLKELDGWRAARNVWGAALEALQRGVPDEMQLIRLDLRDEIAAGRPKSNEEPPEPYRKIRAKINGRTVGDRPEDVVSRFIVALRGMGDPRKLFSSVTLAYLQADSLQPGTSAFEIDAEGEERPLKSP